MGSGNQKPASIKSHPLSEKSVGGLKKDETSWWFYQASVESVLWVPCSALTPLNG